jgi:hypothetical protein
MFEHRHHLDRGRQFPSPQDPSRVSDAPYSHSIVRIVPNELICRCKKFLRLENSRRPNRQMRMAFEFKEEFDRSRKSPLSATINIDRSTYLESTGNAASPI